VTRKKHRPGQLTRRRPGPPWVAWAASPTPKNRRAMKLAGQLDWRAVGGADTAKQCYALLAAYLATRPGWLSQVLAAGAHPADPLSRFAPKWEPGGVRMPRVCGRPRPGW
jgi:hypothetical protein